MSGRPIIIAGPCSVESREQLHETALALDAIPEVGMIRCGVWKPRTRPGGFEGLGETALRWIGELRQQHPSMQFCCEVAKPAHVELCEKYGINALWIGARTAGDPFSMSELTEAMRGIRKTIMVKNPMSPDINAWIGAIERCLQIGVPKVVAVHRGFDVYNNLGYRNNPLWEIPMELRRRMPELPLICDPSHICGKGDLIADMAQTALDFNFDGLMIEVHSNPAQALTDKAQQITPAQLKAIVDRLVVKQENDATVDELNYLRTQIDTVDKELVKLIESRLAISRKIADVKRAHKMTTYQPKRWEAVLKKRLEMARQTGLSEEFVKELFEKLHSESVRVQEESLKNGS